MTNTKIFFIYILIIFSINRIYADQQNDKIVQILESTSSYMTVQVKFDSVFIQKKHVNNNIYHLPKIPGFFFTAEVGKPQLPIKGFSIAIPLKGEVNILVVESQITNKSDLTIFPVPEQLITENSQQKSEFIIDNKLYSKDIWYPQQVVKINGTGFIRNQRIAQIQVSPVQYNPAQKKLKIYKSLTFRITFDGEVKQSLPHSFHSRFENTLQNILLNYKTGQNWRKSKSSTQILKKSNFQLSSSESYKIYIKEDGIYRLDASDFKNAGISISSIDPQTIKIANQGQELPIYIHGDQDGRFDDNDYLEFYGEFNRGENSYLSPYSVSNVYWLTWAGAKGLRMSETDGGLYEADSTQFLQPASYLFTKHFEHDYNYDRLLLVRDESKDHWFWKTINAGQTHEFKFNLNHPLQNDSFAYIKIMLHGSTHPTAYPDHHVIMKINDYEVSDAEWDGQNEYYAENFNMPNNILKDCENILTVELPGDSPAGEIDQIFFNWFEITYTRNFQAVNDFLEIHSTKKNSIQQFKIAGFSTNEISIIDNLGRNIVEFKIRKETNGTYTVIFQDALNISAITYYIYSSNAVKSPENIIQDIPSDLKSTQNGADYIIITHSNFQENLNILADHRAVQGLRVKIVDVQDIYDEFSSGVFDPQAINRFLTYTYENWLASPPLYVLLAGDATLMYDKQVARDNGKTCYIPSIMKYTSSWGMTSSDNSFACVSGDDRLPDMYIGRLPLNTNEDAESIVNKILQYEQNPTFEDWRKKVCLACGDGEFFEESAEHLYNEYIPKAFDVPRLYTNPQSKYFGSTEDIVKIFNNGVSLFNFIGHGGGGVFFDAELFLLEDVALLNNAQRLPVLFSLTCFIGYFDNPWTPSLGEELLRANDRGVVATFGAAGRAWLYGDYYLNNALFESLFIHKNRTLGQVTTAGKWQMVAWSGTYWDHVESYNLLGDPALNIGFPEKEISLNVTNSSLNSNDTLIINSDFSNHNPQQLKLSVFDSNDSLITNWSSTVSSNKVETELILPSNIKSGTGIIKAYSWNDYEDAVGFTSYSIGSPCFKNGFTEPAIPCHLDSTYINMEIDLNIDMAPDGLDSVYCMWSVNKYSWNKIDMKLKTGKIYKTCDPIIKQGGNELSYKIVSIYKDNNRNIVEVESNVFSYIIKQLADLTFFTPGISITGNENIEVQINIKNQGEMDAKEFELNVYDGNPDINEILIANKIKVKSLKASTDTSINVKLTKSLTGKHQIFVKLDQENHINEINEYNNNYSRECYLLTVKSGTGGAMFSSDSNFVLNIPAYSVSGNTSIEIKPINNEEIISKFSIPETFKFIDLKNGVKKCYQLILDNDEIDITKSYMIKFSSTIVSTNLKIYTREINKNQWSYRTTYIDSSNNQIFADVNSNDFLFGLFTVDDDIPPEMFIKVNEQNFVDGDYIDFNPTFSFVFEDESGFNLEKQPPVITINNQVVNNDEIILSHSPGSEKVVLMRYSPQLSAGEYELKVEVTDIANNFAESNLNFNISGELELLAIANHPNPFIDETIIAYTLTGEADEVIIKIYTVSGRLIRTFNYYNELGYIEHVWNGRDDNDEEVANGVYYMKFIAKNREKQIERIEKMAKLK